MDALSDGSDTEIDASAFKQHLAAKMLPLKDEQDKIVRQLLMPYFWMAIPDSSWQLTKEGKRGSRRPFDICVSLHQGADASSVGTALVLERVQKLVFEYGTERMRNDHMQRSCTYTRVCLSCIERTENEILGRIEKLLLRECLWMSAAALSTCVRMDITSDNIDVVESGWWVRYAQAFPAIRRVMNALTLKKSKFLETMPTSARTADKLYSLCKLIWHGYWKQADWTKLSDDDVLMMAQSNDHSMLPALMAAYAVINVDCRHTKAKSDDVADHAHDDDEKYPLPTEIEEKVPEGVSTLDSISKVVKSAVPDLVKAVVKKSPSERPLTSVVQLGGRYSGRLAAFRFASGVVFVRMSIFPTLAGYLNGLVTDNSLIVAFGQERITDGRDIIIIDVPKHVLCIQIGTRQNCFIHCDGNVSVGGAYTTRGLPTEAVMAMKVNDNVKDLKIVEAGAAKIRYQRTRRVFSRQRRNLKEPNKAGTNRPKGVITTTYSQKAD